MKPNKEFQEEITEMSDEKLIYVLENWQLNVGQGNRIVRELLKRLIKKKENVMPCRCCGASRPTKGFTEPDEKEINDLLKHAAKLILKKNENNDYEDIEEWKKAWCEALVHHLWGCPEEKD